MRRPPSCPCSSCIARHSVPIREPALSARPSRATVPWGVFFGRSSSWIRCLPRCWRRCSRSSSPVCGFSSRTWSSSHCTWTCRPIQPGWGAVVGRLYFHAAIQIHGAFAVLVVAERLQRQREQGGFLFGEHGGPLPFGGAVNPCIGPALLPVVQVDLSFLQTFEALSLQRRFLGMADAGLDLPLAVRMGHAVGA